MRQPGSNYSITLTFWDMGPSETTDDGISLRPTYINPRQEIGFLTAINPYTVVNNAQENIRDYTHFAETRYRNDLNYFTSVTRDIFDDDYSVITQRFKVVRILPIGTETRYLQVHLTLETTNGRQ